MTEFMPGEWTVVTEERYGIGVSNWRDAMMPGLNEWSQQQAEDERRRRNAELDQWIQWIMERERREEIDRQIFAEIEAREAQVLADAVAKKRYADQVERRIAAERKAGEWRQGESPDETRARVLRELLSENGDDSPVEQIMRSPYMRPEQAVDYQPPVEAPPAAPVDDAAARFSGLIFEDEKP